MVNGELGLEFQIATALLLDFLIGDPRWFPHPVKWIGRFALQIEPPLRRRFHHARMAGVMAVLIVLSATGILVYLTIQAAALIHPALATIISILILYTCFAARDLAGHALSVHSALKQNRIIEARQRVSLLVGRDTHQLGEDGVIRAAVESVAENTVDGVTAPLFFAMLGGPLAAILYKAASTLDSTFGYKNERYREFGWASACLDDLANYVPARLTSLVIPVAALILAQRPINAVRIALRDGRKHASPNSGLSEASFAGALGIQLGGPVTRSGKPSLMPLMGDPIRPLQKSDILKATLLMVVTSLVFTTALVCIRRFV